MFDATEIKSRMGVADTNGLHVGIVDHVHDDIIELAREGFADGLHHFVPLAAVKTIDDDRIIVEPGVATTVEAVSAALSYARAHPVGARRGAALFGTSGHGTGMGGSGIGD